MPLSPSINHSHLSPKSRALSTSPNFNPFSPLSPHQHDRPLYDNDDLPEHDDQQRASRQVYSRAQLLQIAASRDGFTWPEPPSMQPFADWYQGSEVVFNDPAIASMGPGPGRRTGGYAEGFGRGGGIGGKSLQRGGRQAGHAASDIRHRKPGLDGNGLPVPGREAFGGQMGQFAVRPSGDKMRLGGDDPRVTRDEWRRGVAPTQRQDRRQWNTYRNDNESAQPAWMDDQSDVDPAIVQDTTTFEFGTGEDPIAAHKRMLRAASSAESGSQKPLVSFFGEGLPPAPKAPKPPKQFNTADYLLPAKGAVPVMPKVVQDSKELPSHSRFQRFFGPPASSSSAQPAQSSPARQPHVDPLPTGRPPHVGPPVHSPPPIQSAHHLAASSPLPDYPPEVQSPPTSAPPPVHQPQDHAARLMGMLTAKPLQHGAAAMFPHLHSPSPPPGVTFHRPAYASPPPIGPNAPPGLVFPHGSDNRGQRQHASMPPDFMMQPYPPSLQNLNLGPSSPTHPVPPHHVPLHHAPPHHAPPQHGFHHQLSGSHHPSFPHFAQEFPAPVYGAPPHQVPSQQLPSRQQNMLATLYGNLGSSGDSR